MSENPYSALPARQVWRTALALDPVDDPGFSISPTDPVASAGTCFSQHLAQFLRANGYNYFQPEPPAAEGEPAYSARYGNIHTTRQLRQLILGAYGLHRPASRAWRRADVRYVDPLRPQLFPSGFASPTELMQARTAHLAAVRRVFQDCRIFVFTLSATETWLAPDGTALPLHPAMLDADIVDGQAELAILSAADMRQDLTEFIADLTAVNPNVRIILTVSPLPPAATCQNRHVLTAWNAGRAALRVAAEETAATHANVCYFPADDILLSPAGPACCFDADLCTLTDDSIDQVLRRFAAHFLQPVAEAPPAEPTDAAALVLAAERASVPQDIASGPAPLAGTPVPPPPSEKEAESFDDQPEQTGNLPIEIDFRSGGTGQEFIIAGWSFPEIEYAWTLGKHAFVRLPIGQVNVDCALKFRAGPMVHLGVINFQRLFIDVNGTNVGRLVGRQTAQFEIMIPAALLRGRPSIDISMHMPDAISPNAAGVSGDRRELGFWFSSLRLEPLLAGPIFTPAQSSFEETALAEEADPKTLMMELHSLGGNCELGFVQRFHGAEPLGLLRWAQTPLPNLLRALDARFEGLGDPEHTVIKIDGATEFQIIDKKFGFRNHSFAFQNQGATEEKIRERELVRLPFLARLLIEDLEQSEKLFCYHDAGQSGLEDIHRLLAALEKYGPNWLLWVCPAETAARVGTAELLHDRLIRGYIDRFEPITNVANPSVEAWTACATAAHRIWRGALAQEG